jgi:hypothetical protein
VLVRSRYLVAAAMGLWLVHPSWGQEPRPHGIDRAAAPALSNNQQTANTIADNLRQNGRLKGYTIEVSFSQGAAELHGVVADQPQSDEAVRVVQGVPGVERVVNHLVLSNKNPIRQVQAGELLIAQPETLAAPPQAGPAAGSQEPQPVFQPPAPSPYDLNPPKMPPHAWPTYAPYNNLSRVAYPEAYPYQSWPFIGPFYPFPKVPPGWRSVKLEFEDGHWWFSRVANMHDYWRIRYW